MSEHFADRADLVAGLPDDDPERRVAEQHAEHCAACRLALAESRALMRLLDLARAPVELPAGALERAVASIERELRLESRKRAFVPAAFVLGAWVLETFIAKKIDTDPYAVATSMCVALIAALIAGWNRRGVGATVLVVFASGVFALAMGSVPMLAPAIGVKCMLLELVAASLPWLALRRLAGPVRPRWEASAVAAAGALAGHASLHLSCRVAHADAHLLVFHFGGVVLAAVLGAVATPRTAAAPRAA